jgi:hypothetical protein
MLFGYRMEAISILGREVMKPRGLIGLGYDTIDYCGPEIAIVSSLSFHFLWHLPFFSTQRLIYHPRPFVPSLPVSITPSSSIALKAKIGLVFSSLSFSSSSIYLSMQSTTITQAARRNCYRKES